MKKATKIISFSSPKGGVGRTMTLTNCAKIYSDGANWAGINSSITLLVDFDFHAPGIHYYDFFNEKEQKQYQISDTSFSTFKALQTQLNNNKIGIAFLLSKIINNNEYLKKCEQLTKLMDSNSEKATTEFQKYVLNELFIQEEYNPIKHLIQLNPKSLFILPAGSPNHSEYNDTIFKFDWLSFINKHLGLYLIDCIIYKIVEYIQELPDFVSKPVRILLDQQAGISVSAALNRFLADAHILVGGFNEQNKAGLKALVDSYSKSYETKPWIVLNQYNLRTLPFDYTFNTPDESPHDRFRKEDEEQRVKFIESLTQQNNEMKDKIFVTEFVSEAVQKEHFHNSEKTAIPELIKLIVDVEKSFKDKTPFEIEESAISSIYFIGERIKIGNDYSGPFEAMHKLLQKHFVNAKIIGFAATHEDIVKLAKTGELTAHITNSWNNSPVNNLQDLKEGIYDVNLSKGSEVVIKMNALDFISYPYYIYQTLFSNDYILKLSQENFLKNYPVTDSLIGTSNSYYSENILRWNEYCIHKNKDGNFVIGVPLFFNFQLLAYRRDYFSTLLNLADEFREKYHRQFKGFNDPDDLLRFAKLTFAKDDAYKNVLLCSNSDNIAMWYEWQTIFSIFYYQKNQDIKENQTAEQYKSAIIESAAIDATLMYLKLRAETDKTTSDNTVGYDWDKLIENFYISKENSLIFIWPDSIPKNSRENSNFIYQVPPSFHLFEEAWLLSITKKEDSKFNTEDKVKFLNKYLTPTNQNYYVEHGGLPVHKDLLGSLDIWRKYPFIPPLWSVYQNKDSKTKLNKRDCFTEIFEIGKSIARILDKAKGEINFQDKTKSEKDFQDQLKQIISNNIT